MTQKVGIAGPFYDAPCCGDRSNHHPPLFDTIEVLGKETTMKRLNQACALSPKNLVKFCYMPGRSMVGHETLNLVIGVRIPAGQHEIL